jgi:hypothetical protein
MSDPKADKLNILQDMLIDEFIERIKSGEAQASDLNAAQASDLNAARQLLKDNGIHASLKADNPMAELIKVLPFQDETDNVING